MSLLLLFQNNLPVPIPGSLQVAEQSVMVAILPTPALRVVEQSAMVAIHQPGLVVVSQSAFVAILVNPVPPPPPEPRRRQYVLM